MSTEPTFHKFFGFGDLLRNVRFRHAHLFRDFAHGHIEKIFKIYHLLHDGRSKQIHKRFDEYFRCGFFFFVVTRSQRVKFVYIFRFLILFGFECIQSRISYYFKRPGARVCSLFIFVCALYYFKETILNDVFRDEFIPDHSACDSEHVFT